MSDLDRLAANQDAMTQIIFLYQPGNPSAKSFAVDGASAARWRLRHPRADWLVLDLVTLRRIDGRGHSTKPCSFRMRPQDPPGASARNDVLCRRACSIGAGEARRPARSMQSLVGVPRPRARALQSPPPVVDPRGGADSIRSACRRRGDSMAHSRGGLRRFD
jgi:hypothetical protein